MGAVVWTNNEGYFSNENLSEHLRYELMPECKFRQLAKIESAAKKNKGETFNWNIYSRADTKGGALTEAHNTNGVPETGFSITQGSLTITQYGNSIPYTAKVRDLSEHDVKEIINEVLKEDATEVLDDVVSDQFEATPLRIAPTGGNSDTQVSLSETGSTTIVNNISLRRRHMKAISTLMKERKIPRWQGNDYGAIGRPSVFEDLSAELEDVFKYVQQGVKQIMNGEIGRYSGVRCIEQTNKEAETANFANGLSDACYFFGARPVIEGIATPEEVRAKIPVNYGLDEGLMWYYLGGAALEFPQATNARVLKWDSVAA